MERMLDLVSYCTPQRHDYNATSSSTEMHQKSGTELGQTQKYTINVANWALR